MSEGRDSSRRPSSASHAAGPGSHGSGGSGEGKQGRGGGESRQSSGALAEHPDAELVRKAQKGSHAAFETLVRRYSDRAFRAAYRVLREPEASQDVVQEAFIKAYRSIRRFEFRSAFYTWLYRIVVNLALDRRRRDRGSSQVEWEDGVEPQIDARAIVPESADPERASQRAEILELVARGVRELPDGQREVLLLREVEGLSYEEIAATMKISKGTVMSRLHYARRKMVVFLKQQGVDPEDAA